MATQQRHDLEDEGSRPGPLKGINLHDLFSPLKRTGSSSVVFEMDDSTATQQQQTTAPASSSSSSQQPNGVPGSPLPSTTTASSSSSSSKRPKSARTPTATNPPPSPIQSVPPPPPPTSSTTTTTTTTTTLVQRRNQSVDDIESLAVQQKQIADMQGLISTLSSAFYEQRRINALNLKLNVVNLFSNWANLWRTNKLNTKCTQFEQQIKDGQETISRLNDTVDSQHGRIVNLTDSVSNLEHDLSDQKHQVQETMRRYESSLDELTSTMNNHNRVILRLEKLKFREDLVLDVGIVLFSLWFVNVRLLSMPIDLSSRLVFKQDRDKRKWVVQLSKLFLMIAIIRYLRRIATERGLHSQLGTINKYTSVAVRLVFRTSVSTISMLGGAVFSQGSRMAGSLRTSVRSLLDKRSESRPSDHN